MTIKQFLIEVRTIIGNKAFQNLIRYANKNKIRWGRSPYSAGPIDGSGG